ncbi:hypothetical protein ACK36B_07065 [Aeromonas veronii]|uniref:hypothetical protein n=1 Tax=Aeromonas TaxID=642 RepID=UPI0013DF43E1|nr:hypothetical protein [Aeromonas veronii]MBL0444633.1 hypothetical protein [Aeromonas veronii]MBL0632611.1 hypothetical protein [Aeromonas veronii]MCC0091192.1 hypothetical protein [Aeromonas veronii]MCX9114841.1 hypothetical protein [Aeromonas veronii]QIF43273.1 hypothetical protein EO082_04095 [Aeromonas veronii]
MKDDLVLVALDAEQIAKAKDENGKRKQITHALVVGNYGVMFGTEKQCMKYYSVWKDIFKDLFGKCYETDQYHLTTYTSSGNVVMDLIEESDRRKPNIDFIEDAMKHEKKGFWAKLFSRQQNS